tara:strand:- start:765 stop:1112 length:348 start_codon:yes stop_codon:yes gene_type:complete
MKKFITFAILFSFAFNYANQITELKKLNKNEKIGNKIEIENKSYETVECAVVNGLDQIIARVKVGGYKTITVDIGYEYDGDIRVYYKTSLDYDWKYQAGKSSYSYPPRFIIESDY